MIEKYSEIESRKKLVKSFKSKLTQEIIAYRHNLMGAAVMVFNDIGRKTSEDSFSYHIDVVRGLNVLLHFISNPDTFMEMEYFDKKKDEVEYVIPTRRMKVYTMEGFNFIGRYINHLNNMLFSRDSAGSIYYEWEADYNIEEIVSEAFFGAEGNFISSVESFKLYSDLSKIEAASAAPQNVEVIHNITEEPKDEKEVVASITEEAATVDAFVKEDIAIVKNPNAEKPKRKRTTKKTTKPVNEETTNS